MMRLKGLEDNLDMGATELDPGLRQLGQREASRIIDLALREVPQVQCVAWLDDGRLRVRSIGRVWCAAAEELDPLARVDKTLCGMYVMLRTGSEVREPTCPDCRRRLLRDQRHPAG